MPGARRNGAIPTPNAPQPHLGFPHYEFAGFLGTEKHGVVWVGKIPSGQGRLPVAQVAQSLVQPNSERFQRWGIRSFSGEKLFQCLTTLMVKDFFLKSKEDS